MYISDFSRSFGAGKATNRNTRGLTRSVMARMVPPLPAASRPSKTTIARIPLYLTQSWSLHSSACSRLSSFSYSFLFRRLFSFPSSLSFIRNYSLPGESAGSTVSQPSGGQQATGSGWSRLLQQSTGYHPQHSAGGHSQNLQLGQPGSAAAG